MVSKRIDSYRLRIARKRLGLTQRGAARLLGVTPTQLMEWETGKRMPSDHNLRKISVLYQRLSDALYPELRQLAVAEVAANIFKYGPYGTGVPKERPP